MDGNTWLGIDIGKTKIAAGIVRNDGSVVKSYFIPTDLRGGGGRIMDQCLALVDKLIKESEVSPKGIGIGTIGIVNARKGTIVKSSVKEWIDFPVRNLFSKRFGLPVAIENDVRAAALGENFFGASKGKKSSVYMAVSSGVAVGIIFKGKIWDGAHHLAGQIGPLAMYGNEETLESAFGGIGLARAGSRLTGRELSTKEVFEHAKNDTSGNYRNIIKNAVHEAGLVVALVHNVIDPEIIVVGGSVADNQKEFIASVKSEAERILGIYMVQLPNGINMVHSKLGVNIGIVGAASLVMNMKREKLTVD